MPHILIGSSFQKSNCCSSKIWVLSKTVRKGRQSYHHTDVHNVTQTADNVSQPQGYSFSQNITELTTTENETKKPFRKEKHIKTIQSWVKPFPKFATFVPFQFYMEEFNTRQSSVRESN